MTLPTITLDFDWIDAARSSDKLSHATMARLSLRLGDESLIAILDRRTKSYREAAVVPLFSLAEWLVTNWWFLWYEVEDLQHGQRPGFESRHDLGFAGDGFIFPSIFVVPIGEQVQLRPSRRHFVHAPLEFISDIERIVHREAVEQQFRKLVDAVIDHLSEVGHSDTMLEEEWSALNELDEQEREYCRAAALLGLDPFEPDDEASQLVVRLWNKTDPLLRDDLFSSADSMVLPYVKEWIDESIGQIEKAKSGPKWAELREKLVVPAATPWPWNRGYELARQARHALGISSGPVEFQKSGDWSIHAIEAKDSDVPTQRIEGLVAGNTPSCLIRSRRESGRRFLLARVVGEYLGRTNGSPSLLTSVSSARQRESRAFAAEFLAPSEELKHRIGYDNVVASENLVDELAEDFRVSNYVIRHQIVNHRLGRLAAAD